MTTNFKLLSVASAIALAAAGASPALAGGTTAGNTIQNTVTLNYQVSGVSQTQQQDSDSFVVDRKVNLLVTEANTGSTSLVPGQPSVVTPFDVSNTSNAVIDISLAASQPSGAFTFGAFTIYRDDGDGVFEPGADDGSPITYLDNVQTDDSVGATPVRVWVVSSVPAGATDGQAGIVRLAGTAREATGTAGSPGAVIVASTGANGQNTVETVLADTNADGNTAGDAIHFDEESYSIVTATLTLTKSSRVLWDPVNLTTQPKMIPGAVVEYCIAVQNSGSASASNISISDTLPVETDFFDSDGDFNNGLPPISVDATVTVNSGVASCSGGTGGGSVASDVVTATLSDIPASGSSGVYFKVKVR